jgi:hypothetical protein
MIQHTTPRQRSAGAGELPLSPSLIRYLPFLRSRVLFPGSPARPGGWRVGPLLLLLFVPGVLLYPCLAFRLFEPEEGRYAEIPREMLQRGEGIVPYFQGEPYLDKPPWFYWLVMASYRLFGVHDWAARLVGRAALPPVNGMATPYRGRWFLCRGGVSALHSNLHSNSVAKPGRAVTGRDRLGQAGV